MKSLKRLLNKLSSDKIEYSDTQYEMAARKAVGLEDTTDMPEEFGYSLKDMMREIQSLRKEVRSMAKELYVQRNSRR